MMAYEKESRSVGRCLQGECSTITNELRLLRSGRVKFLPLVSQAFWVLPSFPVDIYTGGRLGYMSFLSHTAWELEDPCHLEKYNLLLIPRDSPVINTTIYGHTPTGMPGQS